MVLRSANGFRSASDVRSANDLLIDVERRIGDGTLKPGERLPPIRTVAAETGLAPNTVAAAYRRLRERGVVVGRGRQGTIVADRPPIGIHLASPPADGVLDAASGNPDPTLLPDPSVLNRGSVHPLDTRHIRYGIHPVDPRLAQLAQRSFVADGITASTVTLTSGALDAVERVLADQLRPGDRVAVEDPGYASIHQLATGLGLDLLPVELDADGPLPDSVGRALAAGAGAIIVTPRAQNPTGATLSAQRAGDLRALLADHPATLLIEDDHAGTVAGSAHRTVSGSTERWMVVRSVAKSLGPDLRLAMVTGDATTVARLEGRFQLGPGWVSHLLQTITRDLLDDDATAAIIDVAAQTYAKRRAVLIEELRQRGVPATGASGLNVWIAVGSEHDVVTAMAGLGWAIRAGEASRLQSPPAVRVTIASLGEEQLVALAADLADVLSRSGRTQRLG